MNSFCTWFADHGQGQLRFPHPAACGDAARKTPEVSEPHGLHQTQAPSAVHNIKGPQSHQPETSAKCHGPGK